MASLKFEGGKYHTAIEAKAHMRHDDITLEARKIAAKNNPHIDVTKSHLNKSLFGLTYEQMCEKYDNRIAMLDSTTNKNKRKDRVTLQNIEVPVPSELDRKNYNKWFIRVAKIICDFYGRENLIDAQIHYDEEHEYLDAETHEKRMSRVHMHISMIPEIEGQLNCKKMSSRTNMRKLNNEIEKMTQNEFACNFMTGKKKRARQTVDELKNKSSRLALEQRAQAVAEAEKNVLQRENNVSEREQAIEEKEANICRYENLGVEYLSRAKQIYNDLSQEDSVFRENKAKLYNQSLQRMDTLHTHLDESLLPRKKSREQEKQMSI